MFFLPGMCLGQVNTSVIYTCSQDVITVKSHPHSERCIEHPQPSSALLKDGGWTRIRSWKFLMLVALTELLYRETGGVDTIVWARGNI